MGRRRLVCVCAAQASLGPLTRSLAKMLYGDLGQGCMHRAAKLFQDAAEKNPERLIHRVCLAKCHLKNGQKESAKKELLLAMKLQVSGVATPRHPSSERLTSRSCRGRNVVFFRVVPMEEAGSSKIACHGTMSNWRFVHFCICFVVLKGA